MRHAVPASSRPHGLLAAVRRAPAAHLALWAVQGVLAALFLFGGGTKLVLPAAVLTAQSPLPVVFLRAVGVLEVLGALGLVLPGLLRRRAELTALAAGGLLLLMCGAVGATMASPATAGNPAMALVPAVVGALAAAVAYGRARPAGRAPAAEHVAGRAAGWTPAGRPAVEPAWPAVRRTA